MVHKIWIFKEKHVFILYKFQEWCGDIVCKQLESGTEEPVDLRLSVIERQSIRISS